MTNLVGFAGSLRAASFNRALLAAARDAMPAGASLTVLTIDDVPLYDADLERDAGIPESVRHLKDSVAAADGLVIVTPEYNGGIPGVAKNVIDWISRPAEDIPRVLYGKPVALMGATPGRLGTVFSQVAWLQVLRTLRMRVWVQGGPFYVMQAAQAIGPDGVTDTALVERVGNYMDGFVAAIVSGGL